MPVKALMPILKSHIDEEVESGRKIILLDGFPRKLDQAAPVEALVSCNLALLNFAKVVVGWKPGACSIL